MDSGKQDEANISALSKARFGEYAAGYVNSTDHAKQDELAHLVNLVQPELDWHMLDLFQKDRGEKLTLCKTAQPDTNRFPC